MNWECLRCGESVDGEFDRCWKCGADQDGTADPQFSHADNYEPAVTDVQPQFGIASLAQAIAAAAMIFSCIADADLLTGLLAMIGFVWLLFLFVPWLMTARVASWQSRHRRKR